MDPSVSDGIIDDVNDSWAGITRLINTTDFEQSNVEYLEFWLMDPFLEDDENTGGKLTFNLGNISEDIIKKLSESGYTINEDYIIQLVPNITNITYGRGVGYKIEQESFDSKTESISATNIRKSLRDEGKIK